MRKITSFTAGLIFVILTPFLFNSVYAQDETKITASDAAFAARFGSSVAICGNMLLVGAKSDAPNGLLGAGAAYVFERVGTNWHEVTKLIASDAKQGDLFGVAVDIDGEYLIVGASLCEDNGYKSGAAYIFKRTGNTWLEETKILAEDGSANDRFGCSVSISGDYAAIGAYESDAVGYHSGTAYIFKRDAYGWFQQARLSASDAIDGGFFGKSVSIDGNYCAIGADMEYYDSTGACYVFKRNGTNWSEQAKLTAADSKPSELFGFSVSLSDDRIVVGSYGDNMFTGSAYVFVRNGMSWHQEAKLIASDGSIRDSFGHSVSIDGEEIVIGALYDDDNGDRSGSAYVFARKNTGWNEVAKLIASDGTEVDQFGEAVCIHNRYAAIGAAEDGDQLLASGSVYLYDLSALLRSEIVLSVGNISAFPGDTIGIPITVEFPAGKTYDAAEIAFGSYQSGLQFIEIDTASSIIGDALWTYQANETGSLLMTGYAGSQDISGNGIFCNLKFKVTGEPCTDVPITFESALFNTGEDSVITTDGSVKINPIPVYGDVDENGLIQAHDAALILKHLVGIDTLLCQQLANADVTLDGSVSALDASMILQYIVVLIDSLPYDTTESLLLASGKISMNDGSIQAGEIVDVPLYLDNSDNIFSFEGRIAYNPIHLTLAEIIWASQLNQYTKLDAARSGKIQFAGCGTSPSIQDGIFATLRFIVDDDFNENETTVKLHKMRWNENTVMENIAISTLTAATAINQMDRRLPAKFELLQCYPNPFNPETTIRYQLPVAAHVELIIYNISGDAIRTLTCQHNDAGYHQIQWDGKNDQGVPVASGLYVYRLKTTGFDQAQKMLLLR
ncbi:T9SS type A sorting domain-containing protein [candidate division KSB1 bacterium]|nr:T9SS type A sorting domain-containing protein [candidate division KSB1 bacterium]